MTAWRVFSTHFAGIASALTNDLFVSAAGNPDDPGPDLRKFIAIWDTGATNSVITKKVVQALGIQPIGKILTHGVHGSETVNSYMVHIVLPNKVRVLYVQVTEAVAFGDGSCDVLIGMDIISRGDFAVTNHNGKTCMTFRMPSKGGIDFVRELQENPHAPENMNRQQRRKWERQQLKKR